MSVRICAPHCGLSPETTSGGETYEREILIALARYGFTFELILARGKRVPEGVRNWRLHRLPIRRGLRWPVALFLLPPWIKRVHDTVGFDVLRVHSLRFIGPAALWARRRYRLDVPVVAHHHHLDPDPLNGVIERRVIEGADRVITGSEFARRQLVDALGVRIDHVAVVPYGIDSRFSAGPRPDDLAARLGLTGKTVVLFVGGLKARKNLFMLLDLWRDVAAVDGHAHLVVVGGGALLPKLKTRAERLGIAGRVTFTGYVPEADKPTYYRLADVFVFPSSMEGFGLAVGEAMSSGLPIVASNRGSIPELVPDGEGGFLCDPDVPSAFAERLLLLLRDRALRDKLGQASAARIDQLFRWERCARLTAAMYEETLAAWRRRGGRWAG